MTLTLKPLARLAVPAGMRIDGLHAMKLLAALLVLSIHVPGEFHFTVECVNRIGVPFFFMVSGFFLTDGSGCLTAGKIKKTFVKILKLTLAAQVFYFALWLARTHSSGGDAAGELGRAATWLRALAVGDKFEGHLWYLTAMLQGLAVIWVAVKLGVERTLLWAAVPLLAAVQLLTTHPVVELPDAVVRLWPYMFKTAPATSLPWMCVGVALRRMPSMPAAWVPGISAAVLLAGAVAEAAIFAGARTELHTLTALALPAIFCLACAAPAPVALARLGAQASTGFYIMHPAVLHLLRGHIADAPALFAATAALTLLAVWAEKKARPWWTRLFGSRQALIS